jgi:hypothetical protein
LLGIYLTHIQEHSVAFISGQLSVFAGVLLFALRRRGWKVPKYTDLACFLAGALALHYAAYQAWLAEAKAVTEYAKDQVLRLTPSQIDALASVAPPSRAELVVSVFSADPRIQDFSKDLQTGFIKAGWKAPLYIQQQGTGEGLRVLVSPDMVRTSAPLIDALKNAHLKHHVYNISAGSPTLELRIGEWP